MIPGRTLRFAAFVLLAGAGSASAQALVEIPSDMPGASYVPQLSDAQRLDVLRHLVKSASRAERPVSLTPNAPYAPDGSHLSFWKPSFVIGTAGGGEAGINYWGKFQEGHMNIALPAGRTAQTFLDCRVLTAGRLEFKVYGGDKGELQDRGEITLQDNHAFLLLPAAAQPASVELWPAPQTQPLGILGCELSAVRDAKS